METVGRARNLDPDEAIDLIESRLRELQWRWHAEVASVAADAIDRIGSLEQYARQARDEYRRALTQVEQGMKSEIGKLSARLSELGVPEHGIEIVLRNFEQLTTAREYPEISRDENDHAGPGVARFLPQDVIEWTSAAIAGGIIGNLSTDILKAAWRQGRSRRPWLIFGSRTARDEVESVLPDDALNLLAIYAVVVRCRELGLASIEVRDLKVVRTSTIQSGHLVIIGWPARPGFSAQVRMPFEDLRSKGAEVTVRMPRES